MLPSKKIQEIIEKAGTESDLDGPGYYYKLSKADAIIKYLDEEYEKNKPCEHEELHCYSSSMNECDGCEFCFRSVL